MTWTAGGLGLIASLGLLISAGACSHRPAPPERIRMDPSGAASAALAQYDTNRDGKIDAAEMKKSPPLLEALKTIDTDSDGAFTAAEVAARVKSYSSSSSIIIDATTTVTLDGAALEGATVTYEPEPFLGSAYQASSGVTNASGMAIIKGQNEKFPGLYLGLYRVRISKKADGREWLLPRYNTETILGKEIAPDAPSTHALLTFQLSSDPNAPPPAPFLSPPPAR